jgi:hypothetical protein
MRMTGEIVTDDPALPIEGTTEVGIAVEDMWEAFANVPGWPDWNPCMAWARVTGGKLKEGATLYWAFRPIRRRYLYRMPARWIGHNVDPSAQIGTYRRASAAIAGITGVRLPLGGGA